MVIDTQLELWDMYGNEGWPARYLWDQKGALFSMHYGEGAYEETEREIQELLGVERDTVPPQRAEDAPGLMLPAQTEDQPGAYSGPYEAGAVWAVDGQAEACAVAARLVSANGARLVSCAVDGLDVRVTVELLEVSGGLAAFSGLYYAIAVLTDSVYRAEFLEELESTMRDTFRERAEYLRLRAAA